MFTDFYKKIIIPGRPYNDSSSSCGYFWNTNQSEQITILNGARDIYGNYLMNYTTPAGATGIQLDITTQTSNIQGSTIMKLFGNGSALNSYYDKDNDQWVTSSSGLSNYFNVQNRSEYSLYNAGGIGTTNGGGAWYAPLYSDALIPGSYPTNNTYGYAASDFIMIGTGNTANTSSTYKLEAPVSAADCNFSIARTINGYNITIVNKKNIDLVISELGYCVGANSISQGIYSDLSSSTDVIKASDIPAFWNGIHHTNTFTIQGLDNAGFNRNFPVSYHIMNVTINPMLCCRTVLPNPITILAGERITITWNFELDI